MAVSVTSDQITKLAPHAIEPYARAFANADVTLARYGINTSPLRVCHFLAQVLTETGDLEITEENLNYSASRLCEVWPKHFPTIESAVPFAHNPEKLGNFIYGATSIAEQLGNTEPGDGYRFRGRGLLQITGCYAYNHYGQTLGIGLKDNPDLAYDPQYALAIAGAEWQASGYHGKSCNALADADDLVGVTFAINGGQNGIDQREIWLKRTKSIWLTSPTTALQLASRALAVGSLSRAVAAASGFPARAASVATQQWQFFGEQTYDLFGHQLTSGHKEGEDGYYQKVGEYWRDGLGDGSLDGRNHDVPWSAAFISWVMRQTGAGDRFAYGPQHSTYIYRAIRDYLSSNQNAGYWCYRLNEQRPAVGSLVCWTRETAFAVDYDHQHGGDYRGHCDIVVDVRASEIDVIGGNVGDSVTKRPVPLDASGYVNPFQQHGETLFALMQCRIV